MKHARNDDDARHGRKSRGGGRNPFIRPCLAVLFIIGIIIAAVNLNTLVSYEDNKGGDDSSRIVDEGNLVKDNDYHGNCVGICKQ